MRTSGRNSGAARGPARASWLCDARFAFVLLGAEGILLVTWQIYAGAKPWTISPAPTPFAHPLAVCRAGLLLATVWAFLAFDWRRRAAVGFLLVAVFSVSALALALYIPLFLLAVVAIHAHYPRDTASQRRGKIAGWSLLAVSAILLATQSRDSPRPGIAQQGAAAWLEHDNLFRAHWEATNWSALERASGTLGAGTLLRAKLEHRLGRTAKALDTLAEIRSTNASPDTQQQAAKLMASWAEQEKSRASPPVPAAAAATR